MIDSLLLTKPDLVYICHSREGGNPVFLNGYGFPPICKDTVLKKSLIVFYSDIHELLKRKHTRIRNKRRLKNRSKNFSDIKKNNSISIQAFINRDFYVTPN
jgi:hypothetical protein